MGFTNQLITRGHHPVVVYKKSASAVECVGFGQIGFWVGSQQVAGGRHSILGDPNCNLKARQKVPFEGGNMTGFSTPEVSDVPNSSQFLLTEIGELDSSKRAEVLLV